MLPASSIINFFSKHLSSTALASFPSLNSIPQVSPIPLISISSFSNGFTSFSKYSLTIFSLALTCAGISCFTVISSAARPATIESWQPLKVPLCSPGLNTSKSLLNNVTAKGIPYPPIDFDIQTISGTISALSKEKKVPDLEQPICTSSQIRSISCLSQKALKSCKNSLLNT